MPCIRLFREAYEQGSAFGSSDIGFCGGVPKTINVEFISANPTGPMHIGHGRWAALGNALCNVLEHAGWRVTREFYINDAGVQMDLFGASIAARYQQLCGLSVELNENHYAGAYITDIARDIFEADGVSWLDAPVGVSLAFFREFGYTQMLERMQAICEKFGVHFDIWFSERSLYERSLYECSPYERSSCEPLSDECLSDGRLFDERLPDECLPDKRSPDESIELNGSTPPVASSCEASPLAHMLQLLNARGYLYDKDGATWFRSTEFGDDKDRVLIKADGAYTYFAPDIAYHISKFERGSEFLINIWGADHHGYVSRMQAACAALGYEGKLRVVLGQLVNLFRGGELVRMSKRTGELVSFEELVEEVGADATKYLMLARSSDQPIDFDIELAKKQDVSNPVYYVQYAHARICSLLSKAAEQGIGAAMAPATFDNEASGNEILGSRALANADLTLLVHPSELDLARVLARFSEVVEACARDLAPFRLTHYSEELACAFHRFYTECQVIGADKKLASARLYLAAATRNALAVTLGLLGVNAPERM